MNKRPKKNRFLRRKNHASLKPANRRRRLLMQDLEGRLMWAADTFAVARPAPLDGLLDHYVDQDAPVDGTQAIDDIQFVYGKDSNAPDVSVNDDVFAGDWGGLGFDQVGTARNNSGFKQILLDTDRDPDPEYLFHFGAGTGTGTAFSGDFNGDGFGDVGVWYADPGAGAGIIIHLKYAQTTGDAFPLNQANTSPITPDAVFQFGLKASDVIMAGDFTGDGRTDIAAVRNNGASPKDWIVSNAATTGAPFPNDNSTIGVSNTYQFGLTAHIPVVGDWDDNGIDNFGAISEGTNGSGVNEWFLDTNFDSTAELTVDYGLPGDIPYTGHFADLLWDGGIDTNFNSSDNWSANTIPGPTDSLVIDQPGTLVHVAFAFGSGQWSLHSIASNEALSIPAGATVTINNPSIVEDLRVTGGTLRAEAAIDATVASISAGTFQMGVDNFLTGAPITVTGGAIQPVNGARVQDSDLTLNSDLGIQGTSDLTLNGVISGSGGVDKVASSTGALVLAGNNTYTGDTSINAGVVQTDHPNAIPATSAVTFSGAGVLNLGNTPDTLASISGTTTGGIQLGAQTLTFGDATNTTFNGPITGAGGLIKQGAGTFTLNSAT
ncbi:MAG: autotransporter-associated beta strand repeat-containing protein, partial [Pirellulaceae bacterium]